MSIFGHSEVDIEKVSGHWSVRTVVGLKEILRISFHWAFDEHAARAVNADFFEALYTCATHFPVTAEEREDVFARFPHLRGRAAIGEEDASAGPVRVSRRRRVEEPVAAPAPAPAVKARTGVGNRRIG